MSNLKIQLRFAALIKEHLPPTIYPDLYDIGGGTGGLNLILTAWGYQVVTIDPKTQNRAVFHRRQMFTLNYPVSTNAIVGLHPDGATEIIIRQAANHGIPFAIVPCCVMPILTNFKGDEAAWIKHLLNYADNLGFDAQEFTLTAPGKNVAIMGRPKSDNT